MGSSSLPSGAMAPPKITAELAGLFKDAGVKDELTQWCEQTGILTVRHLGNFCDTADQVGDRLVAASGLFVNDPSDKVGQRAYNMQTSLMKQAWKEADAQVTKHLKRQAEGLPSEAIDEPLSDTVRTQVNDTFYAKYSFDLDTYLRPADTLLGRVRREFEKQTPSFLPLAKIRSIHTQTRTEDPKKHKAGEGITLVIENEFQTQRPSMKYRAVLLRLEVLANTWGMAGCYVVIGRTALMCHWQEAVKYYRTLRDRTEPLLDVYSEESVVEYLISVEESFRGHVLDLVRRRENPMNWGEALTTVLEKHTVVWTDASHILSAGRGGGAARMQAAGSPRGQAASSSVGQVSDRVGKLCTCTDNNKKQRICKAFNDSRGCPKPCKKGGVHCCDIELESGGCCGQSHPRLSHDPAKHGRPKFRPNN